MRAASDDGEHVGKYREQMAAPIVSQSEQETALFASKGIYDCKRLQLRCPLAGRCSSAEQGILSSPCYLHADAKGIRMLRSPGSIHEAGGMIGVPDVVRIKRVRSGPEAALCCRIHQ